MEKSGALFNLFRGILVPIPLNNVLSYVYVVLNLILQLIAPHLGPSQT